LKSELPAGALARPDKARDFHVRIDRKDFSSAAGGEPRRVLRDVAFDLPYNRFTCLTGPSGCGKTTLLRILLGLDSDFVGEVDPALSALRTAAVFQEPRLLPWRTVEENIRLVLPSVPKAETVPDLVRSVGLLPFLHHYPAELSLGMARRVALARAFFIKPELLVLDEPFVSLDEATADALRDLLLELCAAAPVTVLMVTHNLAEAAQLADRVLTMSQQPSRIVGRFDLADIRRPRLGQSSVTALERITSPAFSPGG
jgi:NitT/TauT family transport system ATP-binding protein